ncbi:hypothetical protein LCI18_013737 [Fusarium solani-melongenae]|uniref:Uncharacterized protein n=1 Tax=Fusarium solani subsp. cucurbitae TaxID=2747967 RepID=A0ACD3ZNY2_FUSSC|nr:hypothetical protein LCI18_013737 [Fusarium solani-melongenae]
MATAVEPRITVVPELGQRVLTEDSLSPVVPCTNAASVEEPVHDGSATLLPSPPRRSWQTSEEITGTSSENGDEDTTVSNEVSELDILHTFHAYGLPWAEAATKEVLLLTMDQVSLPMLQAFECLTLYWFGIGNPKNALAYRFCCMDGYGQQLTDGGVQDLSLEGELRRRCFWACWASACISAQSEPHLNSAWSEVANVPLPAAARITATGWKISLGGQMGSDWLPVPEAEQAEDESESDPPIAASLVVLIGAWAKIQVFSGQSSSMAPDQRVKRLRYLSGLARSVHESGPAPIARSTLRLDVDSAILHQLLLIDALYHMCQMALHSTMVPYFSPSSDNSSINVNLVRTSIQSVLLHADSFAAVLKSYMDNLDASYICPLVGYGAYMAGAILITVERSIHQRLMHRFGLDSTIVAAQDRIGTAKALARVLRTVCKYWIVLRIPTEKLLAAIKALSSTSAATRKPPSLPFENDTQLEKASETSCLAQDLYTDVSSFSAPLVNVTGAVLPVDVDEHAQSATQPLAQPTSQSTAGGGQRSRDWTPDTGPLNDDISLTPGQIEDMSNLGPLESLEWDCWNLTFGGGGLG